MAQYVVRVKIINDNFHNTAFRHNFIVERADMKAHEYFDTFYPDRVTEENERFFLDGIFRLTIDAIVEIDGNNKWHLAKVGVIDTPKSIKHGERYDRLQSDMAENKRSRH